MGHFTAVARSHRRCTGTHRSDKCESFRQRWIGAVRPSVRECASRGLCWLSCERWRRSRLHRCWSHAREGFVRHFAPHPSLDQGRPFGRFARRRAPRPSRGARDHRRPIALRTPCCAQAQGVHSYTPVQRMRCTPPMSKHREMFVPTLRVVVRFGAPGQRFVFM